MEFRFFAEHPSNWLANFASSFNLTPSGNRLLVPRSMGEGFLEQHALHDGVFLTSMDLKLFQGVAAKRNSNSEAAYFPLICYISDSQIAQDIGGQRRMIGKHTPNGMFFPSPRIESAFHIPAGEPVKILTISLPRQALHKYFMPDKDCLFTQLVKKGRPFFLFELLSGPEHLVLQQLASPPLDSTLHLTFLFAKVLEITTLFVEKVNSRKSRQEAGSLAPQEVERLFQVRQRLEGSLANPPTVRQLSLDFGISESKLQRNFKAIFGRSVYQYVLYYRMERAKALLKTGRFTVSEVGFELGYSNMSKFSRAFRKQFGIAPKELL